MQSSGRVHAHAQLATLWNGVTPFDKCIKEVFLFPPGRIFSQQSDSAVKLFYFMWFVLLVAVKHRVLPNKHPFVCHHKRLLQTGLYASVPKDEDFCLINVCLWTIVRGFLELFYDRRAVEPLVPHAYVPAKAMAGDIDVQTLRGKRREDQKIYRPEEKWRHPH